MATASAITRLWRLAFDQPYVDVDDLARAVDEQLASGDLDYRTRLLIRRSVESIREHWPHDRSERWMDSGPGREALRRIMSEKFDEEGFPYLRYGVVVSTRPETVRQFLAEVDALLLDPLRLVIGGAISMILAGYLSRQTHDIDVVNEVPMEIRKHHAKLHEIAKRYRLELGHFQSHYLPAGWESRIHWWSDFRHLRVYLIDPYDFFVGKLVSVRDKDRDDLRAMVGRLDKSKIIERLPWASGQLSAQRLREMAEKNWYILFGEPLPAPPATDQEHKS